MYELVGTQFTDNLYNCLPVSFGDCEDHFGKYATSSCYQSDALFRQQWGTCGTRQCAQNASQNASVLLSEKIDWPNGTASETHNSHLQRQGEEEGGERSREERGEEKSRGDQKEVEEKSLSKDRGVKLRKVRRNRDEPRGSRGEDEADEEHRSEKEREKGGKRGKGSNMHYIEGGNGERHYLGLLEPTPEQVEMETQAAKRRWLAIQGMLGKPPQDDARGTRPQDETRDPERQKKIPGESGQGESGPGESGPGKAGQTRQTRTAGVEMKVEGSSDLLRSSNASSGFAEEKSELYPPQGGPGGDAKVPGRGFGVGDPQPLYNEPFLEYSNDLNKRKKDRNKRNKEILILQLARALLAPFLFRFFPDKFFRLFGEL